MHVNKTNSDSYTQNYQTALCSTAKCVVILTTQWLPELQMSEYVGRSYRPRSVVICCLLQNLTNQQFEV